MTEEQPGRLESQCMLAILVGPRCILEGFNSILLAQASQFRCQSFKLTNQQQRYSPYKLLQRPQ